jgi:hypothetical protein
LSKRHGLETEAEAFRSEEGVRGHDWEKDPTGGLYLERLGARYGPRYGSGWNYLSGKNLNQPSNTKSQEATPQNKEEKPPK